MKATVQEWIDKAEGDFETAAQKVILCTLYRKIKEYNL